MCRGKRAAVATSTPRGASVKLEVRGLPSKGSADGKGMEPDLVDLGGTKGAGGGAGGAFFDCLERRLNFL